ncbi:MAG: hypothetical protein QOI55_1717 [Actinomycetota bacterium]|nr:hypothetical protein [Actinomycetota bacterium]
MGSLWTPSGEYEPQGGGDPSPPPQPPGGPGGPGDGDEGPSAEEIEALRELHARLSATPVEDVVANHIFGLWQLALVYLGVATPPDEQGRQPMPNLPAASLVIDAVAALLDGVGGRLGEHESQLRDTLTQTQMIYVQLAEALAAQDAGDH